MTTHTFLDLVSDVAALRALTLMLQLSVLLALGVACLWALRNRSASLRCLAARATLGAAALSVGAALFTSGWPALWSVPLGSVPLGAAQSNKARLYAAARRPPAKPQVLAAPIEPPEAPASAIERADSPSDSPAREVEPQPVAPPSMEHESRIAASVGEAGAAANAPPEISDRPANRALDRALETGRAQARPAEAQAEAQEPVGALALRAGVLLWLAGALLGVCWLLLGWAQVAALRRRARPATSPALAAMLQVLAPRSGLQVLESGEAGGPFLCGLWRPAIVVPRGFADSLDATALRAVLAHEAAHQARRDLWWSVLARLSCALLWPQPLAWALARQLEASQEEACDQSVLSAGCAPCEYAECLVRLAEKRQASVLHRIASVGAAPSRSALARRVRHILSGQSDAPPSLRFRIAAAAGAAAGVALSLGLIGAPARDAASEAAPTVQSVELGADVSAVAFSPDGKYLACGAGGGDVRLYEASTRRLLRVWKGSTQVYALSWSPDSRTLANAFGQLWDAPSGRVIATLPVAPQDPKLNYQLFNVALAWSPDGKTLASGGSYRTIMRRDESEKWRVLRRERSGDWIYSLAFSPDGSRLAEGGMNHVDVWQTAQLGANLPLQSLQSSSPEMWSIKATEPLMKRYAAIQSTASPNRAELSDLRRAIQRYMDAMSGGARQVAFSPDGQVLAVAESAMSRQDTRRDGSVITRMSGQMRFESLNREQGKVVLWDTRRHTLQHLLLLPGASAQAIAFSPDGRLIAAAEGELAGRHPSVQKHQILIWDVASGQLKRTMRGHTSHINSLSWAPDGQSLASGSRDKTLRLWSLAAEAQAEPAASLNASSSASPQDENEVLGVVRDPNGRDVPHAWVVINLDVSNDRLLLARSDASGRFRFAVPNQAGNRAMGESERFTCWARAYAPGWAVSQTDLEAGRDNVIRLEREVRVRGVVRDKSGRGVAGVPLWLSGAEEPHYSDRRSLWVPQVLAPALTVRSDARGRYEVRGVPALDMANIEIGDPRFVRRGFSVSLSGAVTSAPPQGLRPASFVMGRVLGVDGEPRAGIEVSANTGRGFSPSGEAGWSDGITDRDGRYRIGSLPPARVTIRAQDLSGAGVARALENIVLRPNGVTRLPDIRLRRGGIVQGRVVDRDSGKPLGGALVGGKSGSIFVSVASDEEGRYSLRLPAGKASIDVSAAPRGYLIPTLSRNSQALMVTLAEGQAQTYTVRLKKGLSASGVALTPEGKPAAKAGILAERIMPGWQQYEGFGSQKFARVRDDGTWKLDALTAGRYKLVASGAWKLVEPREISVPAPPGAPPLRLQLRAVKLPTLEGRVVLPNGKPLPGARLKVRIITRMAVFHEERLSDARGRFRVGPLRSDAEPWLEATKPGYKYLSGGQVTKSEAAAGVVFTVRDIILAPGKSAPGDLDGPRSPFTPTPTRRAPVASKTRPAAISAARRAQITSLARGGASIRGRVRYEDGRPARVTVYAEAQGPEAEAIRRQLNWRSEVDKRLLAPLRVQVRPNQDGTFQARGLGAFDYEVRATRETRGFVSRTGPLVRARRGASVRARDIVLLRGGIVRVHLADSKTGQALRGNLLLGTYSVPRFDNISMSSVGTYSGRDGVSYLTVPAGVASIGLWRNADGGRPGADAYMSQLHSLTMGTYDLSSDDIEVSLDGGPRRKKRDGRLNIPIARGQTRDVTFFLQRQDRG